MKITFILLYLLFPLFFTHSCDGILYTDNNVCSGNGECKSENTCICKNNDYKGVNCEYEKCFGIWSDDDENVCSGNGKCDNEKCICEDEFGGKICNVWKCFGILETNISVCNSHGLCNEGKCDCERYYANDDCSLYMKKESVGVYVVQFFVYSILMILICVFFVCFVVISNKKRKMLNYIAEDEKVFEVDFEPNKVKKVETIQTWVDSKVVGKVKIDKDGDYGLDKNIDKLKDKRRKAGRGRIQTQSVGFKMLDQDLLKAALDNEEDMEIFDNELEKIIHHEESSEFDDVDPKTDGKSTSSNYETTGTDTYDDDDYSEENSGLLERDSSIEDLLSRYLESDTTETDETELSSESSEV